MRLRARWGKLEVVLGAAAAGPAPQGQRSVPRSRTACRVLDQAHPTRWEWTATGNLWSTGALCA